MKLMNQKQFMPLNLQYFAEDGADNHEDSGDDNGDDDQEQSDNKGKTFTQAELDEAIKKRLERERKKAEKKQDASSGKEDDTKADKQEDKNTEKLTALEMKVLCYDHDIAKEYSKEAIALAKAYVDEDTDMDEALEKVIKKFPMFVKGTKSQDGDEEETENKGSWGKRQAGQNKKTDPVEEAFLKRNPGMKID